MDTKRAGVLAGVIVAVGGMGHHGGLSGLHGFGESGFPEWVPFFDTVGRTILIYQYLIEALVSAVMLVVAIGLGYYASRRFETGAEYPRFFRAVTLGSLAGTGLVWAVTMAASSGTAGAALLLYIASMIFVMTALEFGLVVALGAIAGASLQYFWSDEHPPSMPTDTEVPGDSADTASSDSAEVQSQPAQGTVSR